jgi:hypothetical protein
METPGRDVGHRADPLLEQLSNDANMLNAES